MKRILIFVWLVCLLFPLISCGAASDAIPVCPDFSAVTETDDGGSGTYQGLGYRYEIEGNFMPEEEYPGVTRYEMYVFGRQVRIGRRD